jgi:hypothetical protein
LRRPRDEAELEACEGESVMKAHIVEAAPPATVKAWVHWLPHWPGRRHSQLATLALAITNM